MTLIIRKRLLQLGVCLLFVTLFSSRAYATKPPITAVAFAPDGTTVVAVSQSGLHVFDWPTLDLQRTIKTSSPNLHCLSFSPNGKYLAVGGGTPSENGVVEIF